MQPFKVKNKISCIICRFGLDKAKKGKKNGCRSSYIYNTRR